MGSTPQMPQIGPVARRAALLLVLIGSAALLLRLGLTIFAPDPEPGNPGLATRLVRFVSYFTVQSNAAVVLAALAVLVGRDLTITRERALRLAAVVGITVTGVVYATLLAGDMPKEGLSRVASLLLHFVMPPAAVLAYVVVGPWVGLRWSDLPRMLLWPVAWIGWTLLHGELAGWYPYGFVDVGKHGYGTVLGVVLGILVAAAALGPPIIAYDRWRAAPRPAEVRQ